ncbi:hypothetical protein Tdes44962_MAKER01156 [Teratosphaeria destructans]|uniref:Uncharacterized protein n=1 Tax=Teratosphaeria destructans TaxID=418781 RepID=A0A9W7T2E8_9PEZI|nr:hypothetical protein Tdes44962_MAKER01156 [Teratosphaeria destructans]
MNKRERSRTGSYGTESLESGTTERECEVKPRTFRSQEAARQPELKRWPGPVGSAETRYAEDALEQDDENADDDYASDV